MSLWLAAVRLMGSCPYVPKLTVYVESFSNREGTEWGKTCSKTATGVRKEDREGAELAAAIKPARAEMAVSLYVFGTCPKEQIQTPMTAPLPRQLPLPTPLPLPILSCLSSVHFLFPFLSPSMQSQQLKGNQGDGQETRVARTLARAAGSWLGTRGPPGAADPPVNGSFRTMLLYIVV